MDGGQQETLFGVAGNDGGAGVAALEDGVAGGKGETSLGGVLVAATAGVGEDGTDFVLEEVVAGRAFGLGGGEQSDDGLGGLGAIPGGAATDPLGEIGDVSVGEFLAFGGHLEVAGLLDGLDEQALVGAAGNDCGAVVAPLEQGCVGVETEAAGLFGGVAAVAALREDRANLLGEELDVVFGAGVRAGGRACGGGGAGRDDGWSWQGGSGLVLTVDGRRFGRRQGGEGGEGTEGEITGRSRKWPQSVSPS